MTKDLVGLIDADFIKYYVAYDIERMFKQGLNPDAVIPYNTIVVLTQKRINEIMDATNNISKNWIFLFSGKTRDNYRSQIACVKKYKGNRTYTEKYTNESKYRDLVEDYIRENFHYHIEEDLEADDLCVMAHSKDTYIYSNDKDLQISPGYHYNIRDKKFFKIEEDEAFRILMIQCLSGDSVDNIMGVDGTGKVIAGRIVKKAKDKEEIIKNVISTYTKKYGLKKGLDRFVEMYMLVNLKTNRGDYTKEKYKNFFDKVNNLIKE